jgi:mannose-6-phosphate isomerase
MQNRVQHYAWGTRDGEAYIPQLLGIEPQPGQPYAELWMGVHPHAPSSVVVEGTTVSLAQWIAARPVEILGQVVAARFGTLPFLFKVLSAGEALSIQAHPNKAQAQALHARDPEHYADDNHKPELAVALDSLTALKGIKPLVELAETLERYPELADFIGRDVCHAARARIQSSVAEQQIFARLLFATLIKRSMAAERELALAVERLAARLGRTAAGRSKAQNIFLKLAAKYPATDVGLLALFMLNLVHLEPGQGMFIPAGVPHAYLKGNIVECMANSDNVVRVGLTPKFKDARTLLDILDYESRATVFLDGSPGWGQSIYRTPFSEFQVSRYRLGAGMGVSEVSGNKPHILLVTQGEVLVRWDGGQAVFHSGQSLFIPALVEGFGLQAEGPSQVFRVTVP